MIKHYSVLLNESIEGLAIKEDGIYVDGTLGRGGHSSEILKRLTTGHLYTFDKDKTAIEESYERLIKISDHFTCIHDSFANLKIALANQGVERIDGLLLDLGVSSPQFDDAQRGFSYRFDARLDMRMNQEQALSAYEVVNEYSFNDLVHIFSQYGEEPFAKQIARKIESARNEKPIETTFELVELIKSALPSKVLNKKGHPAKKVFQALRIEVNNELQELQNVLNDALQLLKVNGRICVITFQSLEDRIVKQTFAKACENKKMDKRIPVLDKDLQTSKYTLVNRKVIIASENELLENNYSHSAKLRIIERIKE